MKRILATTLAATAALLLSACASLPGHMPDPVQKAMQANNVPPDHLGVLAYPLGATGPVLSLNANQPMQPASTMKLLTAVVALDKLGPNARGFTELLVQGQAQDGVLASPLYLRGGADTELDWGVLWGMLRELREQGVRDIQGGLVVDRTLFQPARIDVGLPPFDDEPEFPYNTIPDALFLNSDLLELHLDANAQNLTVRAAPAWPGVSVDASDVQLVDKPCKQWDNVWKTPELSTPLTLKLHGEFPRGCQIEQEFNTFDRQALAVAAVRAIWAELGGTIAAGDSEAATPADARVVARHRGRPLAEVLRETLKSSDNPLARLTYLRIGAQAALLDGNPGEDTRAAAERTVRAWLAEHHIDATGLVLDNGSGLSRSERITPAQQVALLVASHDGGHGPELLGTLPVAGVDGTLSRRLKQSPAMGRARLKTGTLTNAVGLAGYVPDSQGRIWVVSALLNDPEASKKGRVVLDALIDWIARQ